MVVIVSDRKKVSIVAAIVAHGPLLFIIGTILAMIPAIIG